MKLKKWIFIIACAALVCGSELRAETPAAVSGVKAAPQALTEEKSKPVGVSDEELKNYILKNSLDPVGYVIKTFEKHDLVVIGEHHYIRHIPMLIGRLIPYLYAAGVRDLGIEFGTAGMQPEIDRLITADRFDADLARSVIFNAAPNFPYREYVDIYRAAWNLNRKLKPGEPKFRIVALPYSPNFRARKENMTPEDWDRVWHKGSPEEFIAGRIMSEFVNKNKKALIYGGANHLYTRYKTPVWTPKEGFIRFEPRAGNKVYDAVGDKIFFIAVHIPSYSTPDWRPIYPAGGVIDRIFKELSLKNRGFDVIATPFGKIGGFSDDKTIGYTNFSLQDYCDGYIYQVPFAEFLPVHLDHGFVNESNLKQARENWPEPGSRKELTSVNAYYEMTNIDIGRKFKNLK